MSLQCDKLSGELQDQWSSSIAKLGYAGVYLLCPPSEGVGDILFLVWIPSASASSASASASAASA